MINYFRVIQEKKLSYHADNLIWTKMKVAVSFLLPMKAFVTTLAAVLIDVLDKTDWNITLFSTSTTSKKQKCAEVVGLPSIQMVISREFSLVQQFFPYWMRWGHFRNAAQSWKIFSMKKNFFYANVCGTTAARNKSRQYTRRFSIFKISYLCRSDICCVFGNHI